MKTKYFVNHGLGYTPTHRTVETEAFDKYKKASERLKELEDDGRKGYIVKVSFENDYSSEGFSVIKRKSEGFNPSAIEQNKIKNILK